MTTKLSIYVLLFFSAACLSLTSCEKDGGGIVELEKSGRIRVDITDAPIDDPAIMGVFITIAEVRIDGVAVDNLSPRKTFDISSYSQGRTLQLGNEAFLTAGMHSSIEVVLDLAADEFGNTPGCYALKGDGTKENLAFDASSTISLSNNQDFIIEQDKVNRFIVDFDLRKGVKRSDTTTTTSISSITFLSQENLSSATRIVNYDAVGFITGEVSSNSAETEGNIILYAYDANSFNEIDEINGNFENAITSTSINEDGTFTLAFLPAGEYDVIAAEYTDSNGDGQVELEQLLAADAAIGLNSRKVFVSAGADTQVGLDLGYFLP